MVYVPTATYRIGTVGAVTVRTSSSSEQEEANSGGGGTEEGVKIAKCAAIPTRVGQGSSERLDCTAHPAEEGGTAEVITTYCNQSIENSVKKTYSILHLY